MKKRESPFLEKVQDSSNPFSHHVLPAAGACNNKMLYGKNRTKTKEAMHHITAQEKCFDAKTNQSLCKLDQSLQYTR